MSEQGQRQADVNKQVVEDFFRLFLEGDMDGVMACQTDDFVWDIASGAASGTVPWFHVCQGADAGRALVESYEQAADSEVDEYYAEVALGREKVVSKTTDKSFESGFPRWIAEVAGDSRKLPLRVDFDRRLKLEFLGSKITSDAGLLNDVLGLTSRCLDAWPDTRM